MADLLIRNLWKKYGKVTALKGVNLEVNDGELITILGPSGAGKTSLLQTIAGVEKITVGDIFIGGKPVKDLSPSERDVAMVFETYALYPNKTVFENMAFPLKSPFRQLRREEIEKRVKEIAQMLQIDWLLDRNVSQLSGGQRQRVALGRMLVRHPQLFLMDEPIAHLDAKLRHNLRAEIKNIQRTFKTTTLYTTHDYREALGMGDRVVVLNEGKVLQVGTPEEIYDFPKNDFVGDLVGDPSMNFFPGEIITDEGQLHLKTPVFQIMLDEKMLKSLKSESLKKVKVGLRPSDIFLAREKSDGLFQAEVYVMEPLGVVQIVSLQAGGEKFQVKCSSSESFQMGEKVYFGFSSDRLYLFDYETGLNVKYL
ncbi:MAG: multiple sugar transport system ATP-binding protein [Candidatus Atribacteria bacterium]|nr:multiple sugar transport system ATP-binding protein [Candidatus Atribacteria bacterium]